MLAPSLIVYSNRKDLILILPHVLIPSLVQDTQEQKQHHGIEYEIEIITNKSQSHSNYVAKKAILNLCLNLHQLVISFWQSRKTLNRQGHLCSLPSCSQKYPN